MGMSLNLRIVISEDEFRTLLIQTGPDANALDVEFYQGIIAIRPNGRGQFPRWAIERLAKIRGVPIDDPRWSPLLDGGLY